MNQSRRVNYLVVGIMCLATIVVHATPCPTTSSLDTFICMANEEYHNLQLVGEVEILINAPAPNTADLVEESKKRIKPFLSKAKNTVFFNSHAGESLSDFYIYWVTCIDDFHPYPYENLATYQKRARERYFILQEKANYLKIALD